MASMRVTSMPSTLTVLFMGRTLRYSSLTLSFSLMRLAVLQETEGSARGRSQGGSRDVREGAVDRSVTPAAAEVLVCKEKVSRKLDERRAQTNSGRLVNEKVSVGQKTKPGAQTHSEHARGSNPCILQSCCNGRRRPVQAYSVSGPLPSLRPDSP